MILMAAKKTAAVEQPVDGVTGVWLKSGGVTVSRTMKMVGAVISGGAVAQYVYSRGVASGTMIRNIGNVYISGGGLAVGCEIAGGLNAARLNVYQGGSAVLCVLRSGYLIANGYPAPATLNDTIQCGGITFIQNYANVSKYTISGGRLDAGAGGAPKRVYDLGVCGGVVSIYNSTHVSGAVVSGGVVSMYTANARIFGATVHSGGALLVSSGSASAVEVRRLLKGKVLSCTNSCLLCKAACAYQHQCCEE